jgi:excinuclease ABC subunit C
MVGSRAFSFNGQEFPDAEILSSFLGLYYDMAPVPPDEVLLPFPIADADLKAEWLAERRPAGSRRRKVEVLVPQRGPRRDLVELAGKNAQVSYASRRNAREDAELMLAKLQARLRLTRMPRVIECYDISHVQGSEQVASMVVFIDGKPEKSRYRTYKIQRGDGPDDFAAMYEVLSRRFRRAREAAREAEAQGKEDESTWKLPDLIVVDGGKGQLGMALAAARDTGIDARWGIGLPIVGLAKEREDGTEEARAEGTGATQPAASEEVPPAVNPVAPPAAPLPPPPTARGRDPRDPRDKKGGKDERRPDRIFLPHAKDPIPIRPESAEMFVLQHLRDEAHRFAVTFHRGQRKRRTLRSALSDVTGIGATRQKALLRHFGSLKKIREASLEALLAVPGVGRKAAEAVMQHFASRPDPVVKQEAGAPPPSEEADAEEDALESAFAAVEE